MSGVSFLERDERLPRRFACLFLGCDAGVRCRSVLFHSSGERETKSQTRDLLRRADPPLLPSRRSDDIRSERGGCSRVLVVFVEQIISQL